MSWIDNKQDFEVLLIEIEKSGEDSMLFIREEVREKHISGNDRYHLKHTYMIQHPDKFRSKPYWYLTLSQIYIGLRCVQARYATLY